jgi:signal transduction histidine kinase/phage shock protein PspC (stress-responsive transcriptional regulator)
MTSPDTASPNAAASDTVPKPYWRWPELAEDDRVVAGVSAGLGRELGVDANWVRLAFVILFAVGGWGALLYGAAWAAMNLIQVDRPPGPPVPKGRSTIQRYVGFALVVGGLTSLSAYVGGFPASVVFPLGLLGIGVLLAWSHLTTPSAGGWGSTRRAALIAVGLITTAISLVVLGTEITDVTDAAGGVLLALGAMAALVALSAPWWWRLVRERDAERQARVRSDERAEVAAHLHDSVLQTLSLIQRHSDDPQTMLNLARRQERELRNWLDPNRVSRQGGSVRGRLDEIATSVEELHGVQVEVVVVGDCMVDARVEALLGATREAVVNGAKHSGAERIDLYTEIVDGGTEVFVRDTGKGFDPDAIHGDRQGIRHSIIGRMERVGGSATITSSPGEGTEVELVLTGPSAEEETAS